MNKEYNAESRLILASEATPMTVADAITRECRDKRWLEDVIYYLGVYVGREYAPQGESEEKGEAEA
jgi:hypothetical protein